MSVFYKLYQEKRKGSAYKDKWYARAVNIGTIDTDGLVEEIEKICTVTDADVLAVLRALVFVMKKKLQESYRVKINDFGSFKVARAAAKKAMIPAKYGRIINIASMYGMVGNKVAPCSPYHAAKGGVVNMTRGLASEWGKYNINVNAICPGYFYSPLTKETLDSDFFQQNAQTMIPLSRYGNEGELDTAAIFLASPASSYVTGVILPVDGGYTAM